MDNLRHVSNDKGAMREVLRDRHSWIIMLLYVGTFGLFIGSLIRPVGGRLGDAINGSLVTFCTFLAMACGRVPNSTVTFGEPYAYVMWTPAGSQLVFGGLDDTAKSYRLADSVAHDTKIPGSYSLTIVAG